ncbi:MAG: hypothetical protein [Microvirus sp.]|nr:MAG: hypothetical protein [Microvirus sp.]
MENKNKQEGPKPLLYQTSASGLRIRTRSGWKLESGDTEKRDPVSQTVRNQSYSIKEMIEKQSMGISLGTTVPGFFTENATHDDEDVSKVANYDLYEQEMYANQVKENTKILEEKSKAELAEAKQKREEQRNKKSAERFEKHQQAHAAKQATTTNAGTQ